MRALLQSEPIHKTFGNIVKTIITEVTVYHPLDAKDENPKTCKGIWDTGSDSCLVSQKLVDDLGLKGSGSMRVVGVHGEKYSPVYTINLKLSNGYIFYAMTALVGDQMGEDEILIGMNIINKGDFSITNFKNRTTFSFRIPSIGRVNFKEEKSNAIKAVTKRSKGRQKKNSKNKTGNEKNSKRRH